MAKKIKKSAEIVGFSLRLPKPLYDKLAQKAEDEKRSINKQSEIIFEKELA